MTLNERMRQELSLLWNGPCPGRGEGRGRGANATFLLPALLAATLMAATACNSDARPSAQSADTTATPGQINSSASDAVENLANAAGTVERRSYAVTRDSLRGELDGVVTSETTSGDSAIVPTHDVLACSKFVRPDFPSRNNGVGNAIVWLAGVERGRANDNPLRFTLMLNDCQLVPSIAAVAVGGTILINSRDKMMSRLRFRDVGQLEKLRTTVELNDAGQVVPTSEATREPGIVEIRDDLHPWIRGYLAVSPHPYVGITDENGEFRFENVAPGTYTVVVWHERFATRTQKIVIREKVHTKVRISLNAKR